MFMLAVKQHVCQRTSVTICHTLPSHLARIRLRHATVRAPLHYCFSNRDLVCPTDDPIVSNRWRHEWEVYVTASSTPVPLKTSKTRNEAFTLTCLPGRDNHEFVRAEKTLKKSSCRRTHAAKPHGHPISTTEANTQRKQLIGGPLCVS